MSHKPAVQKRAASLSSQPWREGACPIGEPSLVWPLCLHPIPLRGVAGPYPHSAKKLCLRTVLGSPKAPRTNGHLLLSKHVVPSNTHVTMWSAPASGNGSRSQNAGCHRMMLAKMIGTQALGPGHKHRRYPGHSIWLCTHSTLLPESRPPGDSAPCAPPSCESVPSDNAVAPSPGTCNNRRAERRRQLGKIPNLQK